MSARGETVAIVGESGSGKSQAMLGAMGLAGRQRARDRLRALPRRPRWSGSTEAGLNRIRGAKITMIFQEPMTSLDPLYPIGCQIAEPLVHHQHMDRAAARRAG